MNIMVQTFDTNGDEDNGGAVLSNINSSFRRFHKTYIGSVCIIMRHLRCFSGTLKP